MSYYCTCPYCGAHLDSGERCDCIGSLYTCLSAAGFWRDDAQVASEICEKFWAGIPGIYVCAEELGQNPGRLGV